jgi:hypothetical protein
MDEPKKRGRPPKPPQPPKPKAEKVKPQIIIPELPPPRKRSKQNIPWDQDIEILARLATVANLMVQGARGHQIAEALSIPIRTAQRDMQRVFTLWRRDSMQQVDDARAKSIAQYEEIKTRAWEGYRKASAEMSQSRVYSSKIANQQQSWLELAMKAQAQIDDLLGLKITKLDIQGKIEHSINPEELSDDQLMTIIMGE